MKYMKINCFPDSKVKIIQEFFYQVPWKLGQCPQVSEADVYTLWTSLSLLFARLTETKVGFNHS